MEQETAKILENIRKIRIGKGVSVLALANEVEIAHSHLFYIESKRVIPSIDIVVKIAKALHIQIQDLIEM
jgi:DNA-binding XRE family transcriptional regulator